MTIPEALASPASPSPMRIMGLHREDLMVYLGSLGVSRAVEIGTLRGVFAETMCQTIPGLSLTCVDPWIKYLGYHDQLEKVQARLPDIYVEAQTRLAPYHCDLWRMTSEEAAPLIPDGSLDFVFIDGNHAYPYVIQDLDLWVPKVRPGGFVTGHDYHRFTRPPYRAIKVMEALNDWTRDHQINPWFVLQDGTWFWEKR